ncbi:MAG: S8 family serine peptidase, partial [bacterium]|nr:S8 family serine peptidase [bacterium]
TFEEHDGLTAVITRAANLCDSLGIVAVTAMGNGGPAPATIRVPADAFNVLAVGAVDASGTITNFSSRGPTYDRRVKPEVCAMGIDVRTASDGSDDSYRWATGTSFAAPLIAGAATVLIEARPELTPRMIREALKTTASRADQVDYTYGWGIIDLGRALTWPVEFAVDRTSG